MSLISPAEAVRQFDVSKPTLYSDMNDGKLSFKLDDRKKRKLDIAELQRLYEIRKDKKPKTLNNVKPQSSKTESNVNKEISSEAALLKKQIEFLEREITLRKEDADKWKEAFDKAQETAQKVTLLLEHHNGEDKNDRAGDWQKSVKALEQRIANQEKAEKEREEREKKLLNENKRLKQAYGKQKRAFEEEKNKGWFKKLFG